MFGAFTSNGCGVSGRIWVDEDFILDRELWPPTDYHRSIYLYHAEQQPWLSAEPVLIIERVEEAGPAVRPSGRARSLASMACHDPRTANSVR